MTGHTQRQEPRGRRQSAANGAAPRSGAIPVTMLLLGDPTADARVIKTTRSLQRAGYAVTLFCLAAAPQAQVLPDLEGAMVRWVTAPRPLSRLTALIRRLRHRPQLSAARIAPAEAAPTVPAELRAFAGTLWLNLALARAAARYPAALIHANDLDTLLAGVLIRRWQRAALIYDSHELYPEMFSTSSPLYVGLWRMLEHRLIGAASAVITVNDSIAGELQHRHRLAKRPAVVMNCPPLTDLPSLAPDQSSEAPRHRLIYHGRFQAERGLETLIRAMPEIDTGAVLCLRGSGPLRPTLEQLVAARGVADRVSFLDPLPPDKLVADLQHGSIGLVPYLPTSLNNYYCTPNKLFEYMMGGLAVVAGDLPELRRAVAGSEAGVLYPPSDPEALARAVNAVLADPDRLARYGCAARRAALDRYSWEAQERVLYSTYATVATVTRWRTPDEPRERRLASRPD